MPPIAIEPERLAAELEADADVIRSLRENGDVESIVRPVGVLFVGDAAKITRLSDEIEKLGWRITGMSQRDSGRAALNVERDQSTDVAAIRGLTETALKIEAAFGVEYDGWGTIAQRPQ